MSTERLLGSPVSFLKKVFQKVPARLWRKVGRKTAPGGPGKVAGKASGTDSDRASEKTAGKLSGGFVTLASYVLLQVVHLARIQKLVKTWSPPAAAAEAGVRIPSLSLCRSCWRLEPRVWGPAGGYDLGF